MLLSTTRLTHTDSKTGQAISCPDTSPATCSVASVRLLSCLSVQFRELMPSTQKANNTDHLPSLVYRYVLASSIIYFVWPHVSLILFYSHCFGQSLVIIHALISDISNPVSSTWEVRNILCILYGVFENGLM